MSIDVSASGTTPQVSDEPARRTRRVVVGVVLALLLAVLASCLVYRQTVRSERQATFDAVVQSQTQLAFQLMQATAFGQLPADSSLVTRQVELDLPYSFDPGRTLTVDVPRSRLGGEKTMMQLDIESTSFDLPAWTGQPYEFMSILLEGTYISKDGAVSIDESACVVRLGNPFAPMLTEQVELGNGYLATPCTEAQIATYGLS